MTEFSESEVARWFCAIAQTAALSFADETFRPVLIRFWVVIRSDWVWLRFCSATIAPTLVFTENDIGTSFSQVFGRHFGSRERFARSRRQQASGHLGRPEQGS